MNRNEGGIVHKIQGSNPAHPPQSHGELRNRENYRTVFSVFSVPLWQNKNFGYNLIQEKIL
ncbi:hypothetical protein A2V82_15005 [candidate division KSB1 bacterium RBG_16_48_16]|nr:MAG: hypothetical protein A2V82_15000 [candidate division KSB1 bacterium RBG_16_48_16]OGC00030.1 MAG: hypothetical protein A2V82_15005 [candidate division KSB1 bacterium RBG_16_48_16]